MHIESIKGITNFIFFKVLTEPGLIVPEIHEEEPEQRPKITAQQRWLWAYNKIIMQLDVSTIFILYLFENMLKSELKRYVTYPSKIRRILYFTHDYYIIFHFVKKYV